MAKEKTLSCVDVCSRHQQRCLSGWCTTRLSLVLWLAVAVGRCSATVKSITINNNSDTAIPDDIRTYDSTGPTWLKETPGGKAVVKLAKPGTRFYKESEKFGPLYFVYENYKVGSNNTVYVLRKDVVLETYRNNNDENIYLLNGWGYRAGLRYGIGGDALHPERPYPELYNLDSRTMKSLGTPISTEGLAYDNKERGYVILNNLLFELEYKDGTFLLSRKPLLYSINRNTPKVVEILDPLPLNSTATSQSTIKPPSLRKRVAVDNQGSPTNRGLSRHRATSKF